MCGSSIEMGSQSDRVKATCRALVTASGCSKKSFVTASRFFNCSWVSWLSHSKSARANARPGCRRDERPQAPNSSSNAFASFRSRVSKFQGSRGRWEVRRTRLFHDGAGLLAMIESAAPAGLGAASWGIGPSPTPPPVPIRFRSITRVARSCRALVLYRDVIPFSAAFVREWTGMVNARPS